MVLLSITDLCLDANSSASIQQIMYCAFRMPAGSDLILGLVLFGCMIYGMYKFRIPMVATIPLAIVLLYFLGFADWALDQAFTNLFWLLLIVIGGISFLAVYRLMGRG